MSVHFSLSDIDSEIPSRKEATKIGASSSKPFPTHFLSKKRKAEDLYDINNPASNLLIAADVMIEEYTDKVKTIDALTASLNKRTLELEKAKRKIEALKIKLADKSDREEGSFTNNNLLEEVKRDATIAVLESKIHMATEAAENGLDVSLWNVKGWKNKLAGMKDEYSPKPYFIGFGESMTLIGKATKAPKMRITESLIKGEASNSKDDEKMVAAADTANSEESSG